MVRKIGCADLTWNYKYTTNKITCVKTDASSIGYTNGVKGYGVVYGVFGRELPLALPSEVLSVNMNPLPILSETIWF